MRKFYKQYNAWIYVAPALILYTIFSIAPLPVLIRTALYEHNSIKVVRFVGLENFIGVFHDKLFWTSHYNTYFMLAVTLFISLPLCLLMALLLDRTKGWVRGVFKFGAVLPSVLSISVIGQLYKGFLDADKGIINNILKAVGLESWALSWLARSDTAIYAIAFIGLIFGGGITIILFYAGIKAIPPQYYEAASIDGANFWQASWKITIPMLQDIMKYILITSVVGSLTSWELIQCLTGGGPSKSTYTVMYYIKVVGFQDYNFGYACAAAFVFFIECVLIAFIVNKLTDKEPLEF